MLLREAALRFSNHKMRNVAKCQVLQIIGSISKCMDGTRQTSRLKIFNVVRCMVSSTGNHRVLG